MTRTIVPAAVDAGVDPAMLLARIADLEADNRALRVQVARLAEANARLKAQVEELRRAAKRQAAPFSKGTLTPNPRRPGRKPGSAYGTKAHRPVPPRVDRVVAVPLPTACPHCGGELQPTRIARQYQEDLPPARTVITRYDVELGRCRWCRRRIQPRHPEQTSQALGAAGVGLGPRAVALAAWLSKGLGLPASKLSRLFAQLGLAVTPGGLTQAVARAARCCQPTYQALVEGVRASPVVAPDETGWRVAGAKAWLWAFVGDQITVYRIATGRGYQDAMAVLGEGFAGVLERDGWAPYRKFVHATHQTCLAHLLRRCHELLADADRGQAKTPHAVRRILQAALAVRVRHDAGELDAPTLAAEADRLATAIDKLVAGRTRHPPNRKLLDHLARERAHLFTFLAIDGVAATNWRAEHALRPAVVTRKAWGGNRTWAGAATWQALTSLLRTAHQQQRDPVELLGRLLQAPSPVVADLRVPGRRGEQPAPT
jgi:transposase